jgi:phospholipid/cholesterol/gamma-HCH transport system substrate-binding protein
MDTRTINGARRRGAFPETTDALRAAAPTIAFGRPYTLDFVGWMDDFSTTGAYDALGGFSRAWINFSEILYGPGPKTKQFRRCPGANEMPAPDGTNVFSAEEAAALDCDPNLRSVGP